MLLIHQDVFVDIADDLFVLLCLFAAVQAYYDDARYSVEDRQG